MLQADNTTSFGDFKLFGWMMKAKRRAHDDVVTGSWVEEKVTTLKRSLSSLSGSFNKRFFTVDMNVHIIQYANSSYSKRFSIIPFVHLRGVDYLKGAAQISKAKPGWLHGIVLTTKDRQLELWLQTKEDCEQWVRTFEKAIEIGRTIQAENTTRNLSLAQSQFRAPSTFLVDEASPSSFAP